MAAMKSSASRLCALMDSTAQFIYSRKLPDHAPSHQPDRGARGKSLVTLKDLTARAAIPRLRTPSEPSTRYGSPCRREHSRV